MLLITAFAAVVGGLMVTAHATETNSTTTSDTSSTTTADLNSTANCLPLWGMSDMAMGDQGFGRGPGHGMGGLNEGFGNIEVSSEYTQNINDILNNDTDVQNLISQGYNLTSIRPIVKNVIEADGTLTAKKIPTSMR